MMKKNKLQKILFSKELLKATKEVQKEWIQELGLENLDQTEIVDINEYPLLKDPPEADEHWEMLMAGLPKDPEASEAIEKFLKKAVKHHERYKKSFIEEIINCKHSNIGKGTRKNPLQALHNLIEQFDIQFCKEHGCQQSAEFVSNVLQKRLFNEKTKIEVDPDDLIKDVSNEDDQIIWKNPITGIYGQPLKWVSVPKTIHDMRKKREKIKPS